MAIKQKINKRKTTSVNRVSSSRRKIVGEDVDAENSRYTGNQESREEKIRLGILVNKIIERSSSYAQE